MNNKVIKSSFGDKAFMAGIYVFLSAVLVIMLYPLIYVVSASFSSPDAVANGKVFLLPVDITTIGYEAVFQNQKIVTGFLNSVFYLVAGTALNLMMTMLAAYPLSRKEFYGKKLVTGIFVFTMYFSGGLVPSYLLMKNLGLLDTRAVLIIPVAMSVWNVIIARTYLQSTIPDELFEAASLDGCSEIGFFLRIVLPLSKPIMAVLVLYYGVGHWNSYFNAMIYLKSPDLQPLQIVLREILLLGNVDMTMITDAAALEKMQGLSNLLKYAVIVVASLPMMCIYPFVQKHFVKGVMIGSLKG
ncbi:carbohydrate ABC transporter permease [Lachnotalea sp. AF33-28]|uniref:carbohydrate ABC transporter permease n=1 Tax=Lachnotalea sp. AF33-28 TaxID=2292046 RepID=UPI000E54D6B9|nr:carbohydrate ABC transporter permease [Lachnotalea sp. AF33-28]